MGKRLEYTPRSKVRNSLRMLFLRSRERAAALKAAGYTCQGCGRKQSKAKGHEFAVEVHHIDEIRLWDILLDMVYAELLVSPQKLEVLCRQCHGQKHGKEV